MNKTINQSYTEGLDMNQFKHIPDISYYEHNYYIGFNRNSVKNDLLFAEAEDDNEISWYIVHSNRVTFQPIGYSYKNEGNRLRID